MLQNILSKQNTATIQVQTLGNFCVWVDGKLLNSKDWGREKAIQLFQFFITNRQRKSLHKEQILDRLWEEDGETGDQIFKVALHGLTKALEPNKISHSDAKYIIRIGLTYQINTDDIFIDSEAFEALVTYANQQFIENPKSAKESYKQAIALYQGTYLTERLYDDWSCDERERIQVLALGAIVTLAEMELKENPMESIRLSQQALIIDETWEDAYRIQIEAFFAKGNRPMAIKAYQNCEKILNQEMGIKPLPETRRIFEMILSA